MKPERSSSPFSMERALEEALARFRPLLSAEEWQALLEELKRPLAPALRLNPLKVNPAEVHMWAEWYGWRLQPVPFCPTGWQVVESAYPVSQTIEHRLGYYYIQDAASMLPVELFDFPPDARPLILDMAASPGGKTTHLVARTNDRGLVIANDSSHERLTALRLVLQTWGGINLAITGFPGERWGGWYPETFDAVLLDAPCSMQSLRPLESHPMRPISQGEQRRLAQRQVALLLSGLRALRVGGQMVYATCTLAPEEDEAVLEAALQRHPGTFEIESVDDRLPAPAPALEATPEHRFPPQVRRAVRLWPHRFHTAGFFAARLRKVAPVPSESGMTSPPQTRTRLTWLRPSEMREVLEALKRDYGLDMQPLFEVQVAGLVRREDYLYAAPRAFEAYFGALPVVSLGLPLLEATPEGWVLTHEGVARFGRQCQHGRVILPAEMVTPWLRGEDVPLVIRPPWPKTRVVIVTDVHGRVLGRGRVQRTQLKNLLPRRVVLQQPPSVP
ncbi:hypothetical protein [uncultured Thermanaerothrix sp.]|uniref:hypothetical protein n=1 Tax=uncultured Thermanaerothrix sp. TaxID=1195149 RepID=UPI00262C73DA|nr:hypothetical protein [uncultured Thermanaerothrix sp.]